MNNPATMTRTVTRTAIVLFFIAPPCCQPTKYWSRPSVSIFCASMLMWPGKFGTMGAFKEGEMDAKKTLLVIALIVASCAAGPACSKPAQTPPAAVETATTDTSAAALPSDASPPLPPPRPARPPRPGDHKPAPAPAAAGETPHARHERGRAAERCPPPGTCAT